MLGSQILGEDNSIDLTISHTKRTTHSCSLISQPNISQQNVEILGDTSVRKLISSMEQQTLIICWPPFIDNYVPRSKFVGPISKST